MSRSTQIPVLARGHDTTVFKYLQMGFAVIGMGDVMCLTSSGMREDDGQHLYIR